MEHPEFRKVPLTGAIREHYVCIVDETVMVFPPDESFTAWWVVVERDGKVVASRQFTSDDGEQRAFAVALTYVQRPN